MINQSLIKSFNKADIILIVILTILICLSFFAITKKNQQTSYAICEIDRKVVKKILLSKSQRVDLRNGMELEVKNGRIRVSKSDCLQQICVKHGWLKYSSDIIVCVPNRCIIYTENKDELDYISQ